MDVRNLRCYKCGQKGHIGAGYLLLTVKAKERHVIEKVVDAPLPVEAEENHKKESEVRLQMSVEEEVLNISWETAGKGGSGEIGEK